MCATLAQGERPVLPETELGFLPGALVQREVTSLGKWQVIYR